MSMLFNKNISGFSRSSFFIKFMASSSYLFTESTTTLPSMSEFDKESSCTG